MKCYCVQAVTAQGLQADQWVLSVSQTLGGKGGGSKLTARCMGSNVEGLAEALTIAKDFAKMKLDS